VSAEREPTRLRIGEGYISGYLSVFLGLLSLGGVLCFLFPEFLTTPEFRSQYPVEVFRQVLRGCLLVSFALALLSIMLCGRKTLALLGAGISAVAIWMGGAGVAIQQFGGSDVHLSLDWLLLDLLALACLFLPLELFWPKRKQQTRFHREWKTDLIYFVIGHLFVQSMAVTVQAPAVFLFSRLELGALQEAVRSLPFAAELVLVLLVADLFQYGAHRAFHRIPVLWRFHSVHHSIRDIDWLAGSRLHLVDIVITRGFSFIPLYVLGFSTDVFHTYVVIVSLQAVLAHANTRLPFGPLKHVLVSPQYHHWHHSTDPSVYDKNFAIHFPLIDRIFGTCHQPGDDWPEATGLVGTAFPKGFLRQLAFPFGHDPAHTDVPEASER